MNDSPFFLGALLAAYILVGRVVMRALNGVARESLMALLNLAGLYLFFFAGQDVGSQPHLGTVLFAEYMVIVLLQYFTLCLFAGPHKGWLNWVAFACPIGFLVLIRYLPVRGWTPFLALGQTLSHQTLAIPKVIGISYLAFRCSRLVLEVRNGVVQKPGLLEYFGFAFFVPIIPVGPINTYANHRRGFAAEPYDVPVGRASLRIVVGLVKYQFLGGMCNQLGYGSFLLNGHPHRWIALPIAMVAYYLFLYCNFSGFCDMAIGAAALIGIPVLENFDHPLSSRNMREFWNRWHITLSQWMRDIVFAPLSKFLVRVMGPGNLNHAVAITIFVVFLLIGIWHGVGVHYAAFGVAQAIGVVIVHYYTIFLKKRLGPAGFKAYNKNPWIRAAGVTVTFCYYAVTLFVFANNYGDMKEIFRQLR